MIAHLVQSYGYYAVFALIALESLGIPLPGESALIAAALYAGTTHHLNLAALAAVAASAAVIGDNAGYWIGKTGGRRLAERYGHYVRLNRARLKAGRYLFARHGVKVVFFGRFVVVLRTYAAFLSGLSRMRWSRFMVANAAGGDDRDRAKVAAAHRATSRGRFPRPAKPLSRADGPGSMIRPVLRELTAPNPLTSCTSGRRPVCPGRADGPDLRLMVTHRPR